MRTFATLATAGTFTPTAGGGVLVGRQVANTDFIRALFRYSSFDRFEFFVGEKSEVQPLIERFVGSGLIAADRLGVRNNLELPRAIAAAEISVIHFGAHIDRFLDLCWLRNKYAKTTIPVTGQIHSLSYPRGQNDNLRALLMPPSPCDAILCSSEVGKRVVEESFQSLRESLRLRAVTLPALACQMPVLPLGVDAEPLSSGNGASIRTELNIPAEAVVSLCLARFSEYDKLDLFPLLQAYRAVAEKARRENRPAILLLAGARQGTKTPEMVQLWARLCGVEENLRLCLDFPEERKADLLAAADLFVSPIDNAQETFGITAIEAMAAGLPLVVADYNGYRDSVPDDVGLRVPTHWHGNLDELSDLGPMLYERPLHLLLGQSVEVDLRALEAAMLRLHAEPELRKRMGGAASERAREQYDWKQLIPRYEGLWEELSALPFDPAPGARHPLSLDFARVFGHYPTFNHLAGEHAADHTAELGEQELVATEFGRFLAAAGVPYPVFPDLGEILTPEALALGQKLVEQGCRVQHFLSAIRSADPDRSPWHADYLLGWMRKHDLAQVLAK